MRGKQEVADGAGVELLRHLGDERGVAERLAHLLAGHRDPGVVHPVVRELVACSLRLREFVLVMREAKVDAAAVDVEPRAQVLARHRGALNVPAWSAAAPRRRPRRGLRLSFFVALPEGKISRVALAAWICVGRGFHLGNLLTRQLPVVWPRLYVEIDVTRAVRSGVGVAAFDEGFDECDHLGNVAGGARFIRRGQAAERLVCLMQFALELVGVLEPLDAALGGLGEDLVVDVGHVRDDADLVTKMGEPATQHIEHHFLADVAQMRRTLHGQATVVDGSVALDEGHEVSHAAGGGVIELERHSASLVPLRDSAGSSPPGPGQ